MPLSCLLSAYVIHVSWLSSSSHPSPRPSNIVSSPAFLGWNPFSLPTGTHLHQNKLLPAIYPRKKHNTATLQTVHSDSSPFHGCLACERSVFWVQRSVRHLLLKATKNRLTILCTGLTSHDAIGISICSKPRLFQTLVLVHSFSAALFLLHGSRIYFCAVANVTRG